MDPVAVNERTITTTLASPHPAISQVRPGERHLDLAAEPALANAAEQVHTAAGPSALIDVAKVTFAERIAKVFVEVADTLINEFDLIDFLQMLTQRVASLLDDSTVGLLLADQLGHLQFVAASDENARLLQLFQLHHQEGPCVDAFRTTEHVINTDLRNAGSRWPRFTPHAATTGYRSIHAFPLRLRHEVIGAMGVFGTNVGDLDDTDLQIVQALTDVATIGLLQQRAISRGELLTEQLQNALNSRIIIEQAKGAIAQVHNVDVDTAFITIRAYARRTNRRLGDVANLIITDLNSLPELATPHHDAPPDPLGAGRRHRGPLPPLEPAARPASRTPRP